MNVLCRVGIGLLAFGACSSASDRSIVGPRYIAASSGPPDISSIIDLGNLSQLPAKGALPTTRSDERFVVGELILIEGDDFGKLPTVSIGGRPAKSLARTQSGGIVARIPNGVSAGSVAVEVSHPEGTDNRMIELQRYVATASTSGLHFALAGHDGRLTLAGSLQIEGVHDLCFGHDGRALYLGLGRERKLVGVAMAAKGGPAIGPSYSLGPGKLVELACRALVPTVAVVDTNKATFFDARVPSALSRSGDVALPDGATAAAVSPDGESLAVLSAEGNRLSLISIDAQRIVASLDLLDNETVPLLRDLVFAPAGNEIWVVSGNSAESIVAGTRPTQIHRVAVHGISLSRSGSATIGLASVPVFLAVSHREAVMAAAAVRSTASRATLLLSNVSQSLLRGSHKASESEEGQSSLLRFDLEGKATSLIGGADILSRTKVSHDQKMGYAAALSADGLVLVQAPLTQGVSETVRIGAPTSGDHAIPLDIAP